MERVAIHPRQGWQDIVSTQGLTFHSPGGRPYWDESAFYRFKSWQIDELERATNELHEMCLKAAQYVIDRKRFAEFGIPEAAVPSILEAWEAEPPAIYGRFDFSYDGRTPAKLLEYNADTPTALLEASVIQWYWLQDIAPREDQFNSIHERLVAKWKELRGYILARPLYFVHADDEEDLMTATYMRDTADQAGFETAGLLMKDIGWDSEQASFVDLDGRPMRSIFKLYPWEWMLHEEFGPHALEVAGEVQWIEPIWKMLLSNKAILAILWELYPGHANLLETYLDGPRALRQYVKKPKVSREGANISMMSEEEAAQTDGDYGDEGYVYQAAAPLPNFGGNRPVLGSWVIDGVSAGMGIRESAGPVTDNLSRFVPHLFVK
ncbi:MAG TPA: glutathionylspermidine synthase family protein [Bryobacteraceae bacterium]|jgi:glutathionylspermidine synthase